MSCGYQLEDVFNIGAMVEQSMKSINFNLYKHNVVALSAMHHNGCP